MEKKLLILGAGQYGRVVKEIAQATGSFGQIDFLDDNSPAAIGKLEAFASWKNDYDCAFVAMGNPELRGKWLEKLEQAGFALPVLIHPRAYVSPSAVLGKGTAVEPMAVVHSEARVGQGCLLCAGSIVNHNAQVMPLCQIDCNAVVASNASVPAGTKITSGTVFTGK